MTVVLYLLTVFIWGTTWIAIKLQLGVVPITVSISYRFALAAIILFAGLRLLRKLQHTNLADQKLFIAQGLCLFCFNFLCFYTASQWIASGLVAVIFSTATIWNAVNGRFWFGQAISGRTLTGGVCGLIGLTLMFSPEFTSGAQEQLADSHIALGIGLSLLGTFLFSCGNMLSSKLQKSGIRPLTSNAWAMMYGAIALFGVAILTGTEFSIDTSTSYLAALLYLSVIGSVIGFTTYLMLVGRLGADKAAYCTVLFPVVALNISAVLEGYEWTPMALAGLVLVMIGNIIVFTGKRAGAAALPLVNPGRPVV